MSAVSNTTVIDILERGQILSAAQLQEVRQDLQRRLREPQALLQELVRRGWLTSYQAKQIAAGRGADLVLDRYLLLEPLGAGASGEVFKARQLKLNRLVALKVLRPELAKDKEVVQRFYREIEAASQLSHPNIVHAYEAGPIGSLLVLVMEFVDGTDLSRLVEKSGPLPVTVACTYIRQAAVGLHYAHERGLVHRDIKPSNLLVARSKVAGPKSKVDFGLVKILDLGLARLQQPAPGSKTANLTVLGGNSTMQGTPDYMAPEQAIDFHHADARADIYSLGCTFYYLLAGQAPFPGGTLHEKLMRHQMTEPRPIAEQRAGVPAEVAEALGRMLAKRPPDRYATAGAVAAALEPFARSSVLSQTLPGTSESTVTDGQPAIPPHASASRKRWLGLAAVAGLGLLVAGSLLFFGSAPSTEPTAPAAQAASVPSAKTTEPADPSLLAHWRLDEGTGTTAADASGNGNAATLKPGASWGPGKLGGGLTLEGQGRVDLGASPSLNFAVGASFTVAGWVKTRANYGPIVALRSNSNGNPIIHVGVGYDGAGDLPGRLLTLVRDDDQDRKNVRVQGGPVNDGRWHHFALTRAGDTISLFLDGTPQGSSSSDGASGKITTDLRSFGADRRWLRYSHGSPAQRFFQGSLDDLRIYKRALSPAEIAGLAKPVR